MLRQVNFDKNATNDTINNNNVSRACVKCAQNWTGMEVNLMVPPRTVCARYALFFTWRHSGIVSRQRHRESISQMHKGLSPRQGDKSASVCTATRHKKGAQMNDNAADNEKKHYFFLRFNSTGGQRHSKSFLITQSARREAPRGRPERKIGIKARQQRHNVEEQMWIKSERRLPI